MNRLERGFGTEDSRGYPEVSGELQVGLQLPAPGECVGDHDILAPEQRELGVRLTVLMRVVDLVVVVLVDILSTNWIEASEEVVGLDVDIAL